MNRFLSKVSFAAALALSTAAFAGMSSAQVVGQIETVGPRQERRVVYRPVKTDAPYALTGEGHAAHNQKMVRIETFGGQRDRTAGYRWVTVD